MAKTESRIRLLFFSPYFYPYISGLTQYPYRLFTESKLPLETTCLTFHHTDNLKVEEKLNERARIIRMRHLIRISKGFISPQSIRYFWDETKRNDVIMLNLPNFEGIMLAIFAFLQAKPIIALLHCEVLLPASLLNFLINFFLNCGVFIQLLLAKRIIVYTEDYYKDKPLYLLFKKKIEVLLPPIHSYPIDADYLKELSNKKKNHTNAIGFCGRIAAEKGIEILIESVSKVRDSILFLAGPTGKDVVGEELYFRKIESLLIDNNIPHVFLGTLSAGRLSSFYKSLDVLVLPSLNKTEAFGMVQVESMLQGTPVVASDLPGVRVPIQLTKMGILTTPGDSVGVADAIRTLLKDRELYSNTQLIHNTKALFDSQKTYDSIYSIIKTSRIP